MFNISVYFIIMSREKQQIFLTRTQQNNQTYEYLGKESLMFFRIF